MAQNGPNPKIEGLAMAVARGSSITSAAKRANVSRRTATRWAALPAFRDRVSVLRQRMTDRTVGRLTSASVTAVGTLQALLRCKNPAIVHAAAKTILDATIRHTEQVVLAAQVAELKERIRPNPPSPMNGVYVNGH